MDPSTFQRIKDIVELAAAVISATALVIGGMLAWRKWGKEAPEAPRGELSHKVVNRLLAPSLRLIHVSLTIKNVGTVTLIPTEVYTLVQRVTPLEGEFAEQVFSDMAPLGVTKTEYDWPSIDRRDYPMKEDKLRIDSGEIARLEAEFLVPSSVTSIFVYSLACMDPRDIDLGWDVTTFHSFDEG